MTDVAFGMVLVQTIRQEAQYSPDPEQQRELLEQVTQQNDHPEEGCFMLNSVTMLSTL